MASEFLDKNPGKRLPEKTWVIIQGRYEKGDGVRALGREYGINPSTISNRAIRCGWLHHGALREEAITEVREEVKEEFKQSYKALAKAASGNHFKLYRYGQQLGLRLLQAVESNLNEPDPSKKIQINREVYQLNTIMQTVQVAINGERTALGMDTMKWEDESDGFDKFIDAVNEMRKRKLEREQIKLNPPDESPFPGAEDELSEFPDGEVGISTELEGVEE